MDENKVREAMMPGLGLRMSGLVLAAIKAAVEPLEKRLDEQEDVHIELDDRVYYLEKCVHALEDRLEVLEDCESALPEQEKQQYKHEEYGVWHCNCGKRTFGTLPNYCSDCGASAPVSPGVAAPAATGRGIAALTESMLQVVSEKTGCRVESLELDMEMEADLGIDSIKRVEILGTMMDLYPNLPEMNPEELAELKTLGQIVGHMESCLSAGAGSPQTKKR